MGEWAGITGLGAASWKRRATGFVLEAQGMETTRGAGRRGEEGVLGQPRFYVARFAVALSREVDVDLGERDRWGVLRRRGDSRRCCQFQLQWRDGTLVREDTSNHACIGGRHEERSDAGAALDSPGMRSRTVHSGSIFRVEGDRSSRPN